MKRKLCRTAAVCFCAVEMTFQGTFPSHGSWQTDGMRWQYRLEDSKKMVKSAWHQADNDWYWFDENGFMQTGWHMDPDGRWYFLNPISDGTKGKMLTGWHWINGYCYYLEEKTGGEHPLGAMYVSEKTPDGYEVNQNGAWTDDRGTPVFRSGKGIVTRSESQNSTAVVRGGSGTIRSRSTQSGNGEGKTTEKAATDSPDTAVSSINVSEKNAALAASPQKQVNWQVCFTDLSAHQLQLAPSRSGTAEEDSDLTIYFQTKIIDNQNRIWRSLEKSPYIITLTGPQNRIIYMEYEQVGQVEEETDPWEEERRHLQICLENARQQEADFLGVDVTEISDSRFLAEDKNRCDIRIKSAASRIEPGERGIFYVIGKNYIPEGSVLAKLYGDDMEYSNTVEDKVTLEGDVYILSRFQLHRRPLDENEETVWSGNEKRHWQIGDVQERNLGGVLYRFRCIDQNYGDEADRSRQKALFLCDTVIPADTGSSYSYERMEDGTYTYVFHPGPLVCFGASDNYKYSLVRKWMKDVEKDCSDMEEVSIGVNIAYEGITKPGSKKEMSGQGLKSSYIGNQVMMDRLFILSVDEAIKYRSWLWKFEGGEEENPESQQTAFCKSYWLRTPYAGKGEDKVYVVDLITENIHPQAIRPDADGEDQELIMTGTTGIRPAFATAQN